MGLLEFMAVILFGYLIGFKPSDLKNMLVLCLMGVFGIGIGVLAFMAAKTFLLSPNGPYAIAAILFVCFATWKLGVDQQEPELTPLDRRANFTARKATS
jgi:hypothetical protein